MTSPSEILLVQEELGPLYDLNSLFHSDLHDPITYKYVYGDNVAVQLTVAQELQGDGQSGFFVSRAAQALCEYMEKHHHEIPHGAIVELGAGCGLPGLTIAQLQPEATVVFTDHDPGVLKTIEYNCTQQNRKQAMCLTKRVRWGPDGAEDITALERDLATTLSVDGGFDMVIGSDIIHTRGVVAELFWTVDRLVKPEGVFLMCSNDRYDDVTEREIDAQCERFGFIREIVGNGLSEATNGSRVQRFARMKKD